MSSRLLHIREEDRRWVRCMSLLVVVALCGCKPKQEQAARASGTPKPQPMYNVNRPNTITGQVFMVTNGAENIKLGGVVVHFVPRTAFTRAWEDVKDHAAQESAQLREAIALCIKYSRLVSDEKSMLSAFEPASILRSNYEQVDSRWQSIDQQLDDVEARIANLNHNYEDCADIASQLEKIVSSALGRLYRQLEPFNEAESVSDADGNFFYTRWSNPVVVVARGSRVLLSGSETYYWFVDPGSTDPEQGKLVLSSNNVSSSLTKANEVRELISLAREIPQVPGAPRELPHRLSHPPRPHWAAPGIFYLLDVASVATPTGSVGLPPGTELQLLKDDGRNVTVSAAHSTFTVSRQNLTDNLDIAAEISAHDASVQEKLEQLRRQHVGSSRQP